MAYRTTKFRRLKRSSNPVLTTAPEPGPPARALFAYVGGGGVGRHLCGDPESGPPPLGSAVLGGSAVGPDRGYGPARLLSSDEVRAVAKALAVLAPSEIARRYDPGVLRQAKIYPSGWSKEDRKEWLAVAVLSTQSFYTRVAARGNATLLALS